VLEYRDWRTLVPLFDKPTDLYLAFQSIPLSIRHQSLGLRNQGPLTWTCDNLPLTINRRPVASDQQPVTGIQHPESSTRHPVSGIRNRVSSIRTSGPRYLASCTRASSIEYRVTRYQQPATGRQSYLIGILNIYNYLLQL